MSATDQISFLRSLQRLLDEGEFTATYKFALLQALADLSAEEAQDPQSCLRLPVRRIAEKFIDYYWGHTAPFLPQLGQKGVLRQNTDRQAAVVTAVDALRGSAGVSIVVARTKGSLWKKAVSSVAQTIRAQPLWKLQTIAGKPEEFLYRKTDYADGAIMLLPGVAENFRSFHGLILRLIQGRWAEKIRTMQANHRIIGPTADLESFLFGSERRTLDGYREVLYKIDGSDCFYCGRGIRSVPDVDHFIPWARYPVDLGHNFVLAHSTCNSAKRDFLPHPEHLARWMERNRESGPDLAVAFNSKGMLHDLDRSVAVARWAYEQGQRSGAHAWIRKKEVRLLDGGWMGLMAG